MAAEMEQQAALAQGVADLQVSSPPATTTAAAVVPGLKGPKGEGKKKKNKDASAGSDGAPLEVGMALLSLRIGL
jgi:hypothetical protein